jgi:hypothetical protein
LFFLDDSLDSFNQNLSDRIISFFQFSWTLLI